MDEIITDGDENKIVLDKYPDNIEIKIIKSEDNILIFSSSPKIPGKSFPDFLSH